MRFISYALAMVACVLAHPAHAIAENFRIETNIFEGNNKEPLSKTTTLFCNGVVYDFLESPAQTAVFKKPNGKNAGRFILLDGRQRIRTEISTDQIQGAVENLRTWASEQSQPFLKFAANPDFKETFEPGSGQLVLASHIESYTVETTPATNPQAASEYRVFLDWYAQLNTLLSGGPPPQPRLELNKSLSRHKAIPMTVELTRAGDKAPLRAEHEFTWLLSQNDMSRIEDVNAALAEYGEVKNEDYLRSTRNTGQDK
jgi:hypothetical protein